MNDKGRKIEEESFVDSCLNAGKIDSEGQYFVDLQVCERVYHEEKFLLDEDLEQGLVDEEVVVLEKGAAEREPDDFVV